jgi:hypothetical protein
MPSTQSALFQKVSGIPMISINEPVSSKPKIIVNIKDRFVKGTTLNMCDFVDFKIEKVLKGTSLVLPTTWSNLFSIDS